MLGGTTTIIRNAEILDRNGVVVAIQNAKTGGYEAVAQQTTGAQIPTLLQGPGVQNSAVPSTAKPGVLLLGGGASNEVNLVDKSWKLKIDGTAQRTGNDAAHQVRTYREAIELAKDPDVVSVDLDHGYNRALALDPKTISPNRRPDVTAIYNDGRVARVEVQSATDNPAILRSRNAALDAEIRAQGFTSLPPKVVVPTRTPKLR